MSLEALWGFGDQADISTYTLYGWTPTGGGSWALNTGRFSGSKCLTIANRTASYSLAANARYTFGFAWKCSNASTAAALFRFDDSGTVQDSLVYNGDGTFSVRRVSSTVLGTTANLGILTDVWYYLEIDITIHDTAGAYELRVNGVSVLSDSSVDTRNGGSGTCNTATLIWGTTGSCSYDDGYAASGSSSFQGEIRVVTQVPTGDGADQDWDPSSGSDGYAMVDEIPEDGDTTYISSGTGGDKDTFTFPALGLSGTVLAVQTVAVARKDDSGSRSIKSVVRSGGTDYAGSSHALSTSYAAYPDIWTTDPDTSSAWDVAGVDAAEYGVENV